MAMAATQSDASAVCAHCASWQSATLVCPICGVEAETCERCLLHLLEEHSVLMKNVEQLVDLAGYVEMHRRQRERKRARERAETTLFLLFPLSISRFSSEPILSLKSCLIEYAAIHYRVGERDEEGGREREL